MRKSPKAKAMPNDRIGFKAAHLEYDLAEDPSLDDTEPKPSPDEYWNGLDEQDPNEE